MCPVFSSVELFYPVAVTSDVLDLEDGLWILTERDSSEHLFGSSFNDDSRKMYISDDLLCLHSARVTEHDETYTIEIPRRELQEGTLQSGETYRIAMLSQSGDESASTAESLSRGSDETTSSSQSRADRTDPPVSVGETRQLRIESLGDQGDGIAKIGGGYVVIVPDTGVGERVTVRFEQVKATVAFADVVERHDNLQHEL